MMQGEPLFRAVYRGLSVEVGHATSEELSRLRNGAPETGARDVLTQWSIIALRYGSGRSTALHALGWRVKLRGVWITSPLLAARAEPGGQVATFSGHFYDLDEPDHSSLALQNRLHLVDALMVWGFTDVV